MVKKKAPNNTQRDMLVVLVIALIIGLGGGYLLGTRGNSTSTTNNQMSEMMDNTAHSHSSKYEVDSEGAPKVELVVSEDAKSGYNVKVIATDFTFTPENVNGDNVIGEGHAHLYVDGVKVARLYSPYFHYDGSFEGTKSFRVTLNANDHSEYAVDGKVIESTVQVTHDSSSADHMESHEMLEDDHSHSDM